MESTYKKEIYTCQYRQVTRNSELVLKFHQINCRFNYRMSNDTDQIYICVSENII